LFPVALIYAGALGVLIGMAIADVQQHVALERKIAEVCQR
jgi:hypothetical protein